MGIGSDPAGRCVQTNSQVNCVDIPVINKEGVAILLIKIDTGEAFNTNTIFNIKGINPNLAEGESPEISENPNSNPSTTPNIDSVNQLSRTGAAITILVVISSLVGIFGLISIPQLKKKTKIKLK